MNNIVDNYNKGYCDGLEKVAGAPPFKPKPQSYGRKLLTLAENTLWTGGMLGALGLYGASKLTSEENKHMK